MTNLSTKTLPCQYCTCWCTHIYNIVSISSSSWSGGEKKMQFHFGIRYIQTSQCELLERFSNPAGREPQSVCDQMRRFCSFCSSISTWTGYFDSDQGRGFGRGGVGVFFPIGFYAYILTGQLAGDGKWKKREESNQTMPVYEAPALHLLWPLAPSSNIMSSPLINQLFMFFLF